MNKKIKKKSFKQNVKTKKKSLDNKSDKNSVKTNGEENLDKVLRQELNEIITDFKTSNNAKKSMNKSSNVQTINKYNNNKSFVKTDDKNSDSVSKASDNRVKTRRKLMVRTETKWHEMRVFDETVDLSEGQPKYRPQRVQELRLEAQELLRQDVDVYNEMRANNSHKSADFEWMRTVLRTGTLADKLSAHTVLIQDSAVHNLKSLEQLIAMVSPKGKRECILALDNLRELFVGDLLIPGKKLKTFAELLHFFDDNDKERTGRNRRLIMCLFEEQLKTLYRIFLDSLVKVSHDSIETTKQKSLTTFFDLLVNNGEEEQYLLSNLVNKLGDPVAKVAAQATHLLNQLINKYHPQMKTVVADEVERLLYRPNVGQKAQYYGLCFLSEVIFGADDRQLANKLIKLYFSFFKVSIKKGDIDNKMMSVLLTGVSRAFPYSKLETNLLEEHLQTFYKLIHFVNPNTSIQALLLIFNIIDVNEQGLTDRFYTVLYRHIHVSDLDNCSRKAMLLNLIYRAMKKDPVLRRVKAFIKRLLQIALNTSSAIASSILILVSEVIKTKPGLMLSKEIKEVVNQCEGEDEGEEHYEDVPMSDDEEVAPSTEAPAGALKTAEPNGSAVSWVHNKNADINRSKAKHYDIGARNPMFCGVEYEDLWELALMRRHFHPSTNLFVEKIFANEPIDYSGDPMADFTVKRFLDRFVFRNPKKVDKNDSNTRKVFGRLAPTDDTKPTVAISSKEYVNQSENKIPIDERFIYHYLKQRKLFGKSSDGYDSDVESVTSVEFESLLDRMEPMSRKDRNIDFAKDFNKDSNRKSNKRKAKDDESSDDDESGPEGDDQSLDDEVDFADDDPDFADAFDGVDSELDEAFKEEEAPEVGSKRQKRGFDKMTNELFASADEFAQLLEGNNSNSDLSDGEAVTDKKSEHRLRRKLGRNKKKKTFNKRDLNL